MTTPSRRSRGATRWTPCGRVTRLPRAEIGDTFLGPGDRTLLSRGAFIEGLGYGVKSVTVFDANQSHGLPTIQGAMLVFEPDHGSLDAVIEGRLVTEIKTAADSVLGATFLARPDSTHLLVVGGGAVARSLIHAYRAVFPGLERVSVWTRRPEQARALAEDVRRGRGAGPRGRRPRNGGRAGGHRQHRHDGARAGSARRMGKTGYPCGSDRRLQEGHARGRRRADLGGVALSSTAGTRRFTTSASWSCRSRAARSPKPACSAISTTSWAAGPGAQVGRPDDGVQERRRCASRPDDRALHLPRVAETSAGCRTREAGAGRDAAQNRRWWRRGQAAAGARPPARRRGRAWFL